LINDQTKTIRSQERDHLKRFHPSFSKTEHKTFKLMKIKQKLRSERLG